MSARPFGPEAVDELRLAVASEVLDPAGGPVRQIRCRNCGFVIGSANTREVFAAGGPIKIEPRKRPIVKCQCCGTPRVFHAG